MDDGGSNFGHTTESKSNQRAGNPPGASHQNAGEKHHCNTPDTGEKLYQEHTNCRCVCSANSQVRKITETKARCIESHFPTNKWIPAAFTSDFALRAHFGKQCKCKQGKKKAICFLFNLRKTSPIASNTRTGEQFPHYTVLPTEKKVHSSKQTFLQEMFHFGATLVHFFKCS